MKKTDIFYSICDSCKTKKVCKYNHSMRAVEETINSLKKESSDYWLLAQDCMIRLDVECAEFLIEDITIIK